MSLVCARCHQKLEYSGAPPSFCGYCGHRLSDPAGARPVPPAPCEFPERVADYRLLHRLGEGGMGAVFEAEAPSGQRVAIKLISPDFISAPEAVERFRLEGKLASAISHPRCVFVLAADREAGSGLPYIVMELMPGE